MGPVTKCALLISSILAHAIAGGNGSASDLRPAWRPPPMFIFGDSLTDVGNNNDLSVQLIDKANFPPNGIDFPGGVPTGRFSNGFNGVDFIAMFIGYAKSPPAYLSVTSVEQLLNGTNFGSAGSGVLDTTNPGTINLKTQIQNFATVKSQLAGKLGEGGASELVRQSLFLVVTVNNDMFQYYYSPAPKNDTADKHFVAEVYNQFEAHIQSLYALGARKIWISGLGKLGCVPFLRSKSPTGSCADELDRLAVKYNTVAKAHLHLLRLRLEGIRISYSDSTAMGKAILASPKMFGFTEFERACCGAGPFNGAAQCTVNATYCANRRQYFFWDWFHPTEAIYRLTALFAYKGPKTFTSPHTIEGLLEMST